MAKIKTVNAYPIYTVHFETMDSDNVVSRLGFTLRSDLHVLRGWSVKSTFGWSPMSKKLWRKMKKLPDSIQEFKNSLVMLLEKQGDVIKRCYLEESHDKRTV